jgi:Dictyostelium (slime mold) repeat
MCDPITGVSHTANNTLCNNNLYCDGVETCNPAVGCELGISPVIDDNNICTVDECNNSTQIISHTPILYCGETPID